jgi:hypothetical protein
MCAYLAADPVRVAGQGQVVLAPFAPLDTPTQAVLAADATAVTRFLRV